MVRRLRARRNRAAGAIGYQVQLFQNDPTDQGLTERRADNAIGVHETAADMDRYRPRYRASLLRSSAYVTRPLMGAHAPVTCLAP